MNGIANINRDLLATSPFSLDNQSGYRQWREKKLASAARSADELLVELENPAELTPEEKSELQQRLLANNMAVYQCANPDTVDKESIRAFGRHFGLRNLDPNMLADDDGITSLQTEVRKSERGYIPYSDKRLLWHTDGYYNPPERTIRAMILHCVRNALKGGENELLDHELVYLLMRDESPDLVAALMHPQAMTIPANTEASADEGGEVRPAQPGPVFSVDPASGDLHMRYTARTRSIEWRDDAQTRAAVARLEHILAGNDYVIRHRMQPGQGLICNNVLHNRTAFENSTKAGKSRLVYRARYYDRIQGTCWTGLV